MAVDSEGRILLAAGIDDDPDASGPDLIRVSRLAVDGTIDTSFGSNGSTDITGLSGWSYLQLMTLMVDGQDRPVVIMGANGLPQEADTGAVVRFTEAGALDTAFGGDGYAVLTTESARSNMAPNIGFIDATSGNIYALGGINGVDLYRVTAAGAQDTSFFSDGVVDFDYYYEADVPLFDRGFGFRGNPVALSVDSDESGATVAFTKSVSDEARLLMIKIDFSADETVPFSRTWGPDNYGIPTTYTNDSVTDGADGTPDGIVDTGVPLLELVRVSDEVGSVPAASRTPEQVAQIRSEAVALVEALSSRAPEGLDVPVRVVETETGANLSGLVTDPADGTSDLPVPVEDVLLLVTDEQALLLGGADGPADPADLRGGVLELGPDGEVSALAYGLTPGALGELVVMSSPTLMGTFTVGADGSFQGQAALPSTLAAGSHTVVLAVDGLVASAGVVVTGEVALPVTGSGSSSVPWAVLVVAAGALAVLVIRRRVVV